jgi:hypothetical protein
VKKLGAIQVGDFEAGFAGQRHGGEGERQGEDRREEADQGPTLEGISEFHMPKPFMTTVLSTIRVEASVIGVA